MTIHASVPGHSIAADLSAARPDAHRAKELAKTATPLPWRWWTSNSFRRLSSDATGKDGDVAFGDIHRSDGHPDIVISEADQRYIEHAANNLPVLADHIDRLCAALDLRDAEVAGLREQGDALARRLEESIAIVKAQRAEIAQFKAAQKATGSPPGAPFCAQCAAPATCHGAYEGGLPGYACDACCAHGCEDGRCEQIARATKLDPCAVSKAPSDTPCAGTCPQPTSPRWPEPPTDETPWNWCPKCKQTVEDDMRVGFFHDGSEGTCIGCGTIYVATAYEDGSWTLTDRADDVDSTVSEDEHDGFEPQHFGVDGRGDERMPPPTPAKELAGLIPRMGEDIQIAREVASLQLAGGDHDGHRETVQRVARACELLLAWRRAVLASMASFKQLDDLHEKALRTMADDDPRFVRAEEDREAGLVTLLGVIGDQAPAGQARFANIIAEAAALLPREYAEKGPWSYLPHAHRKIAQALADLQEGDAAGARVMLIDAMADILAAADICA